jgi:hypothetical protein
MRIENTIPKSLLLFWIFLHSAVISGSASTGDLAEPDLIVGKVDPGFELCMPHKALEQQHRYDICFKPEGASGWSNATIFPWCTEVLNMREGER